MDFKLTEEQLMVKNEIRAFAEAELEPGAAERDATGQFPEEAIRKLGELGFLGMMVPEEYGGAGMDLLSYLIAVEELARVDASVAVTMTVTNSVCCWPIMKFGTEEQKRKYLTELASGQVIGGFMLTEPEAGSDAASLRTRYRETEGGWVLEGTKAWITNAGVGRYFVVMATKDPSLGYKGISAFILDTDQDGVVVAKHEDKMGLRSSRTAQVSLEGAFVPKDAMLGREGEGFKIALATLDHSRLGIAAQAVGIAQAALEEALRYTRDRRQFGKPIIEHQAVAFTLAEMETRLMAARSLLWYAAWAAEQGGRHSKQSSAAKLFASETCNWIVGKALQLHGGYGYSKEYKVERLYRDARVTTIYEGTSEVQRMVIARALRQEAEKL